MINEPCFPSTVPIRDWHRICYRFLISLLPLVCGYFLCRFFFLYFPTSIQIGYSLHYKIRRNTICIRGWMYVFFSSFFCRRKCGGFVFFLFVYLIFTLNLVNDCGIQWTFRNYYYSQFQILFLRNFSWLFIHKFFFYYNVCSFVVHVIIFRRIKTCSFLNDNETNNL